MHELRKNLRSSFVQPAADLLPELRRAGRLLHLQVGIRSPAEFCRERAGDNSRVGFRTGDPHHPSPTQFCRAGDGSAAGTGIDFWKACNDSALRSRAGNLNSMPRRMRQ